MTTPTQAPDASTDPVAAAFEKYQAALQQPFGPVMLAALTELELAASAADVLLCEWGDLSPHNVTIRTSCCGDKVCADHEDEHDLLCPELAAQKLEEARR